MKCKEYTCKIYSLRFQEWHDIWVNYGEKIKWKRWKTKNGQKQESPPKLEEFFSCVFDVLIRRTVVLVVGGDARKVERVKIGAEVNKSMNGDNISI